MTNSKHEIEGWAWHKFNLKIDDFFFDEHGRRDVQMSLKSFRGLYTVNSNSCINSLSYTVK